MNIITPFKINFPLAILDKSKNINFQDEISRELIFKRNIYYNIYEGIKNHLLEERQENYQNLTKHLLDYLSRTHNSLKPLNVSIFGSSLFSENPSDYDFLAITEGNTFLLEETEFNLEDLERVKVGISIKGIDNFTHGFCGEPLKNPRKKLEQIINRTAVALFRRHLPIWGYDFVDNKEVFLDNIGAQASDLLDNTFHLYYLDNKSISLTNEQRSDKILSRMYETLTYLEFLGRNEKIIHLRKEVYLSNKNKAPLSESKKLFNKVLSVYKEAINKENEKYD